MSVAAGTKIFGMKVKADPKYILGGLLAVLAMVAWFSLHGSNGEEEAAQSSTAARVNEPAASTPVPFVRERGRGARRNLIQSGDRGALRIKAVDASDGRIDPTLRLDLLARLQTVEAPGPARSLFEAGESPAEVAAMKAIQSPIVRVNQRQPLGPPRPPPPAAKPQVNIPLKYYGFVNPANKREQARGLFMSGDNVLVAKEGDELEGRYLVVALNASSARMEDTQMRAGQILPVTPEANEQ